MKEFQMTERLRKIVLIFIACVGIVVCIFLSIYQFYRYGIHRKIDIQGQELHSLGEYNWSIDEFIEKNDVYYIKGWIARLGEDIETNRLYLVIVNEDGSSYQVASNMLMRHDITELYKDTEVAFNYDASGFSALISKRYVHSKRSLLYVLYQNNGRYEIVDIQKDFSLE